MEPRIATGYEALALRMESFIKYYQPKCWIVPIHDVSCAPMLTADDAKQLRELNNEGKLEETLNSSPEVFNWNLRKEIPFYIQEAILAFFQQ